MSTIVYRDGVLAADTRAYSGGKVPIGDKLKIFHIPGYGAFGVSTSQPGFTETLVAWVRAGADEKAFPSFDDASVEILRVKPDGSVFFHFCSEKASGPLDAPFFAIGTGAQYALGAMWTGADAETAVSAAIELDTYTGGKVETLRLQNFR